MRGLENIEFPPNARVLWVWENWLWYWLELTWNNMHEIEHMHRKCASAFSDIILKMKQFFVFFCFIFIVLRSFDSGEHSKKWMEGPHIQVPILILRSFRNTRSRMFFKRRHGRRSVVFIVIFEQITHIILVFSLLSLNK